MNDSLIKDFYYIIIQKNHIIILAKELGILIIYYIFYIIKYYYKLFNINELYLYLSNILIILLLIIRLYYAHKFYITMKLKINNLYNLFIKILLLYILTFQENNLTDNSDDIDDIEDDIEENNTINNKITHYNNIYYNFNNTNNKYNIQNDSLIFNESILELKNLLLVYITYLFTNCKIKHNNYLSYSTLTLKDIGIFEQFINNEINKIYYNFNINNEQFKLNYLEFNIINNLTKLNKEGYLSNNNYNNLLLDFKIIQKLVYKIIFLLNTKNIIFILIHFINEYLIFINIILLNIYYINIQSDIGIIYVLIINYIYLYINSIIYILLNCFDNININEKKNLGINLDDYLHKIYDEFNIIININLYEKYYIK